MSAPGLTSLHSHAENFHTPTAVYSASTTINNSCSLSDNDKNNTNDDCQRGAMYSKYCMLLVSQRRGRDGCLLITPLLFFPSESQTIQNRFRIFSTCQFLFLVLALIQAPAWKFLRKLLCSPPLLPRPYLRIDLSIFREMQMISVSSCRQSAHNLWASKKHDSQCQTSLWIIDCVCRFGFSPHPLKDTKTSTYFIVLVESVCLADVLRGAYLCLL